MGIFDIFGNSETIYFPGCYTSGFIADKVENYRKILKKLNIDFSMAKDILCCGGVLDESGYEKELRKLARENSETLENKKTKKILLNCPLCFNTFSSYKNLLPNWNIESEFILLTIFNKLLEKNSFIQSYTYESIAYYDSCYLARYAQFTETPRELIKMLGYKIIELPKSHEETICCGSCGGLPLTNPELADQICRDFIKTLRKKKIKKIVTADPRAYHHLKQNLRAIGIYDDELEVLEISDIICDGIGIKRD